MTSASKAVILDTVQLTEVDTPDWGIVKIRPLSALWWVQGGVNDEPDDGVSKREHNVNSSARLIAYSVCDESGRLLFDPGDVEALKACPMRSFDALVEAIIKLNNLGSLETDSKNSLSGTEDSPSSSPAPSDESMSISS